MSQQLCDRFGGEVPQTHEELESLPGVGESLTLRSMLALRWGLSPANSAVDRVERDLRTLFPQEQWGTLHLQLIYFGREYCQAKNHTPSQCPICSWTHLPLTATATTTATTTTVTTTATSTAAAAATPTKRSAAAAAAAAAAESDNSSSSCDARADSSSSSSVRKHTVLPCSPADIPQLLLQSPKKPSKSIILYSERLAELAAEGHIGKLAAAP
eukprot:2713-Heterococcus_DN1.PRE.1